MVDPEWMCDRHLLGEHVECHMLAGAIGKGKSVRGYIDKGLVELNRLWMRHGELAAEMERRGMNHKSPFPARFHIDHGQFVVGGGGVDRARSAAELMCRCADCRRRFREHGHNR